MGDVHQHVERACARGALAPARIDAELEELVGGFSLHDHVATGIDRRGRGDHATFDHRLGGGRVHRHVEADAHAAATFITRSDRDAERTGDIDHLDVARRRDRDVATCVDVRTGADAGARCRADDVDCGRSRTGIAARADGRADRQRGDLEAGFHVDDRDDDFERLQRAGRADAHVA